MLDVTDYAARAQAHAPRTVEDLREAARGMLRDGHGAATIAQALQLDVHAVRQLIGNCTECDGG